MNNEKLKTKRYFWILDVGCWMLDGGSFGQNRRTAELQNLLSTA
jgi:hypothetical protein